VALSYKIRVPRKGLRKRLGLDDIILALQQKRLRWYEHVLRKEDNDWVKTEEMHGEQESYAQRAQTSADPEDPDFGLWTSGSKA